MKNSKCEHDFGIETIAFFIILVLELRLTKCKEFVCRVPIVSPIRYLNRRNLIDRYA